MKKSLLALAVFGAFASSAFAQSVSVYGVVDAGVVSESGSGDSVTKLSGGVQSGSRIGFKGQEDLGGGLKAVFTMENGFAVDKGEALQGGRLFGRQSFVGLTHDKLGSMTAGRQYNAVYSTMRDIGDPFAIGLAGRSNNLFSLAGNSVDSSLRFGSTNYAGFSGDLIVGFGEQAGDSSASRSLGGSVGYAKGPLTVRLATHGANNATGTMTDRVTLLAGNYDFGVAKAYVAYGLNKIESTGSESRDFLVGASMPFGPGKMMASYVRKNDRVGNNDASQFGVGYNYEMSKRTNAYVAYAHMSNDNAAAYTIGNASDAGTGTKGFNVGLRHSF